jgi:hypothetical protein
MVLRSLFRQMIGLVRPINKCQGGKKRIGIYRSCGDGVEELNKNFMLALLRLC